MRVSGGVWAAALALAPALVGAQAPNARLTLDAVLALARTQSPEVLVAEARIDETRARLAGARARFRDNPTVDVLAGPRRSSGATTTDLDIGVSQAFETGGQRAARIRAAESAIARDTADANDLRRTVLEATALAFFDTAYAEQRTQLMGDAEAMAAETLRIATRRYEAGDIAALDVNLAKSALARARSAAWAANTDRALAAARLARLTGVPAAAVTAVDARLEAERAADLASLRASVDERPDLRALRAGVEEALATVRLGAALTRPDVGLTLRAKREAADTAVIAGFTVTLPAFTNGQEERAAGSASATRLRLELDLARATALQQVDALHAAYVTRREAARAFEQEALPSARENEQLSQRSFEEGELSLPDLLLVRRESLDTRLEYLERLRDAAETAVMRDTAAGVLR